MDMSETTQRRSAVSGLLKRLWEAQRDSGRHYLAREVLREIADDLGLGTGFVRGVASFYSMLSEKPRGQHIIRVCESPPCQLAGAKGLVEELSALLDIPPGGTTADGLFTLELSSCLGACAEAPAIEIDEALYTGVQKEQLPAILAEVKKSAWTGPRPSLVDVFGAPRRLLNGESSSTIQPRDRDYAGLRYALGELSPDDVLDRVTESGLRGRGGAGFPTGRKWGFTRGAAGEPKYIVCNADEGEPGTFKDRVLMEFTPHQIIEGMILAGYAVGAEQGYIYIRGEYAEAIRRVNAAIEAARTAGYLGERILKAPFSFDIKVHQGAGAYVCGEETSLLESMEGKRGIPRLRPPYPATNGLWGRPTVINNVETLANVPFIIREGVKEFRRFGTPSSPGTKLYPLSGAVDRPGIVEAEMGTTLRALIFEHGEGMAEEKEFQAALVGGAAGVFLDEDGLDIPLEYDILAERDAVLGSGAVLVLDKGCEPTPLLEGILHFFAHESCGQCVPCRIGTTRLVELMSRLKNTGTREDFKLMLRIAKNMRQTSLCPLGQSCYPLLKSAVEVFKEDIFAQQGSNLGER
ncbi:MAG: NAD(P)H-dependent oxidoreductase subunit E [Candidatus Bipolaricaulota bacterium]|nr:NAD(P)H-dependent oxidoreductase subunit E [Candidatus Bipolaricaulota bacterium]